MSGEGNSKGQSYFDKKNLKGMILLKKDLLQEEVLTFFSQKEQMYYLETLKTD